MNALKEREKTVLSELRQHSIDLCARLPELARDVHSVEDLLYVALAFDRARYRINLPVVTTSLAVETSNGPTSPQEADILWNDGQKAFEKGQYQDAINDLQRLVDRYPGFTDISKRIGFSDALS